MTFDRIRDRNKAAAGRQAVMGGTEEGVAATKAANAEGGERATRGGGAPERGGGAVFPDAERGGQGDIRHPQRSEPGDLPQTEAEGLSCELSDEKNEFGKPFVKSSDGTTVFGYVDSESGLVSLPLKLNLGENRKDEQGKDHGYGYLHIEAGHLSEILQNGFSSVEEFVEYVARNYTDIKEGAKIGKKQTYLLEVSDKHNNTIFIQLSKDEKYWNVNSAGILKKRYSRSKPKVYSRPAVGNGKSTDTIEVNSGQSNGATAPAGNSPKTSGHKGTDFVPNKQGGGAESSGRGAEKELAQREEKPAGGDKPAAGEAAPQGGEKPKTGGEQTGEDEKPSSVDDAA